MLDSSSFVEPSVKRIEIHYLTHQRGEKAALSLVDEGKGAASSVEGDQKEAVSSVEGDRTWREAALSVEGENLCFTYKLIIQLHNSDREYEVVIDQTDSVSSRSVQVQNVPLLVTRDLERSTDSSSTQREYQESDEMATLHLHTHFGKHSFKNVKVKHKVCFISRHTLLLALSQGPFQLSMLHSEKWREPAWYEKSLARGQAKVNKLCGHPCS